MAPQNNSGDRPAICHNCRYSGWLTAYEYHTSSYPQTCLFGSDGADPVDGDRIIFDKVTGLVQVWGDIGHKWIREPDTHNETAKTWQHMYPLCEEKNDDGQCGDFVHAKRFPFWHWRRWLRREWRTKKMRQ